MLKKRAGAYLSDVMELLTWSASARIFAPFAYRQLSATLKDSSYVRVSPD